MERIVIPSEPSTRLVVLTRSTRHQSSDSFSSYAVQTPREAIPSNELQINRLLDLAAEFVLAATGASGVAIALLGDTGLCCRASIGDAPDKGIAIRIDNTLSGECIRTGQMVRRDNALPGSLAARSMLLLPIHQHNTVAGIVGLFWREAQAINESKIAIACGVARTVAVTLDPSCSNPESEPKSVSDQPKETAQAAVQTAEVPRKRPGVRKRYVGLPCARCGAYYYTDEKCPVCSAPQADAPVE